MIRYTIWNSDFEIEDWLDTLRDEYPDHFAEMGDAEMRRNPTALSLAEDMHAEILNDERLNLNIDLGTPILISASLGLWNGRRHAYKYIQSGNIADCLQSQLRCDSACHWFLDEHGDLRCEEAHHDGVNYYTYRAVKPTPSGNIESRLHTIERRFEEGKWDIWAQNHYTYRLGDIIADLYGWKINQRGYGRRKEA